VPDEAAGKCGREFAFRAETWRHVAESIKKVLEYTLTSEHPVQV
jgi:hypothetical protein